MDGWAQMTGTLGSLVKTKQQRRREKNQRYQAAHRETWLWYEKYVRPIGELAKLFGETKCSAPDRTADELVSLSAHCD